jgi:hypothetical protein
MLNTTSMKRLSILCLAVLFFASCKKTITELPPATQTGANTFGAKVDGALWVPQGFGPIPDNTILKALLVQGDLEITAKNFSHSPNETEFYIFIKNVTGEGTYPLNTTMNHPGTGASYGYYVKRNINPQDEWITSSTQTGAVIITKLDTINHFASGTFYFSAGSIYDASHILGVAEGRFDVKTQ